MNDQQQLSTRPAGVVRRIDYGNLKNLSAVIAHAGATYWMLATWPRVGLLTSPADP